MSPDLATKSINWHHCTSCPHGAFSIRRYFFFFLFFFFSSTTVCIDSGDNSWLSTLYYMIRLLEVLCW